MKDFMKLAWIDLCKTGTYLVMNTPSAAPNLSEQLKKYTTNVTITDSLSDRIFTDSIGTAGIYAHELHKLKLLLDAIYTKVASEENALKDYAFALRNMLVHSEYKSVIKYIEKPSTTPDNVTDYLQYIDAFQAEKPLDSFSRAKYILLYSFIRSIMEANRLLSRVALADQEQQVSTEMDRFFQFTTQNNALKQVLHQHTILSPSFDTVNVDELTTYYAQFDVDLSFNAPITAVDILQKLNVYATFESRDLLLVATNYFKKKYEAFEDAFLSLGLNIHEILQQTAFTARDFARIMQQTAFIKPEKRKKKMIEQLLHTAVAHYLVATTARMNMLFQQEPSSKAVVQKVAKPSNDAPLKKELFDTKSALKQLEAEQAALKKQLKELQQQQTVLQQKLTATQQNNAQLREQLEQIKSTELLTPNAKALVQEIAFLTKELTMELRFEDEHAIVEEPVLKEIVEDGETASETLTNYIDKVKPLKLAVVGGHDKYHSNIKQTFKQDVYTQGPDRLNTDVSKLLNYDVVVFITSYNNHNLYERSYDFMKKNQAKDRCLILNTQPSPKRLAQQVYEFAKQRALV